MGIRLRLPVVAILSMATPMALAQTNLGELVDAGATRLTADEFKRELVGRTIVGPGPSGSVFEMIYLDNGQIHGVAANTMMSGGFAPNVKYGVGGSWKVGNAEQICASMVVGNTVLPSRCQYWYRYDQRFFLSDSDTDRSARVLVRMRQ